MTLRAEEARPDASATALAAVEAQLRDLIRSRGIDPAKDAGTARRLVQEALDAYGERTLGRDLPTIADPADAADAV